MLFRYLLDVGVDRMAMLQRAGSVADVEFLEKLLCVFIESQDIFFAESDTDAGDGNDEVKVETNMIEQQQSTSTRDLAHWLGFVAAAEKCELMTRFASASLREQSLQLIARLRLSSSWSSSDEEGEAGHLQDFELLLQGQRLN